VRDERNTNAFLEHLVEAYGKWLREVITTEGEAGTGLSSLFGRWRERSLGGLSEEGKDR
jgi:hypothetical protein